MTITLSLDRCENTLVLKGGQHQDILRMAKYKNCLGIQQEQCHPFMWLTHITGFYAKVKRVNKIYVLGQGQVDENILCF